MSDLFVNSATGNDVRNGGDTAATALRTITYAIGEADRRFRMNRVSICLAPGVYSNADGESFPLELPQNVSLLGSGTTQSFVRFERRLTDGFELAISGGEELADFTLQGMPLAVRGCYRSKAIWQTNGSTHIHDIVIEAAPGAPAGEIAFGTGIDIENDALINRVTVQDCDYGIWLQSAGFRLVRATVRDNQRYGVVAEAAGEIRDCNFVGNHWALNVWAGGVQAIDNTFDGNFTGVNVAAGPSGSPPIIRGSDIRDCFEGMKLNSEAQVIDNTIVTGANQIGILCSTGTPPRFVRAPLGRIVRPEIRNNRLHSTGGGGRGHIRVTPLAAIGGRSRAVFEGNRFSTDGDPYAFMSVHNEAVPDLGYPPDGRSMGRNIFAAGYIAFFQDPTSPRKTVRAHGNYWPNAAVVQGTGWRSPGDWYVDPWRRRSSVILDTTGAMRA